MIPIKLDIKGLYSFQGKQTIDFVNLTKGQIFGIFGEVGSGKSTILEAISFSLYGLTERLNQKDNRNYNMMNLNSNELLIDFLFESGKDDTSYRFIVEGKRNRAKFEDIKKFERKALKKVGTEWVPIADDAESIIGLSYDNFRRTVIIPQGHFQEFLKLKSADRTRMLKEIFRLDKYDLFSNVRSLKNSNNEELTFRTGQLTELGEVSEEDLKAAKQLYDQKKSEEKKLEAAYQVNLKKKQSLEEVRTLISDLEKQKKATQVLVAEKPHFDDKEKKVEAYKYCQLHFGNLIDRRKEESLNLEGARKQIAEAETIVKTKQAELEKLNADFSEVKKTVDQKDSLLTKAEELDKLLQLRGIEAEVEALNEKHQKLHNQLSSEKESLAKIRTEKASLADRNKKVKAEMPDIAELSELREWFNKAADLEDLQKAQIQNKKTAEDELLNFQFKKLKVVNQTFKNAENIEELKDSSYAELISQAEKYIANWEKEVAAFQIEENHLQVQKKLGDYAEQLVKGEACPVCGSKDHPEPLMPKQLDGKLNEVISAKQDLDIRIKEMEDGISRFNELKIQFEMSEQNLVIIGSTLNELKGKLELHQSAFKWKAYSKKDRFKVDEQFKNSKSLNEELQQIEKQLELLTYDIDAKEKDIKLLEDDAGALNIKMESRKASGSILKEQIRSLDTKAFVDSTIQSIAAEVSAIRSLVASSEEKFNMLKQNIDEVMHAITGMKARIDTQIKQMKSIESTLKTLGEKIDLALVDSDFDNLQQVRDILHQDLDTKAMMAEIKSFNEKLQVAKSDLKKIKEKAEGKQFDQEAYDKLSKFIDEQKQSISEIKNLIGEINLQIKTLQDDLKKIASLKKEIEIFENRGTNLDTLSKLFTGSGFVNYISSVYLQNLVSQANQRFTKLTRQQLKLELNDDNSFGVIDYLNGGRKRSVKTLSGGQTFQASLSLALALAESVQTQIKSKQNFFFLDEGFGTLDKKSLQIVFDTLKSLRKENRIVGVISHVEDLQQEIDVYIKTTNDPEMGSQVEKSWS